MNPHKRKKLARIEAMRAGIVTASETDLKEEIIEEIKPIPVVESVEIKAEEAPAEESPVTTTSKKKKTVKEE